MDKIESIMAARDNITYTFTSELPDHLSGLVYEDNQEIIINSKKDRNDQYTTLLEEIAHYDTGSGEIIDQDSVGKKKQELQARSIAFCEAVPLDGLTHCFYHGIWAPAEIADYFDVSVKFLMGAIDNYRSKRGLIFKYKNYLFDLRNSINITKIG